MDAVAKSAESIAQTVRDMKPGALALIAWTAILCTAVWHCEKSTLLSIWPDLLFMWKVLLGLLVGSAALVSLMQASTAGKSVPQVADEGQQSASKLEPEA